jgi:hypothetical protein
MECKRMEQMERLARGAKWLAGASLALNLFTVALSLWGHGWLF